MKQLRQYFYFLLSGITYLVIHEGIHAIQAVGLGIYEGIRLHPLGVEVMITQPLTIEGFKLAMFSGLSSIATISIGYILLILSDNILKLKNQPFKNYMYYVTFLFLVLDPLYISILSFFVGGDINGITLGLNLQYTVVRIFFFIIAIINIYLVVKKLYRSYSYVGN